MYNLNRFKDAHIGYYNQALNEIRSGRKTSHWIWFIFPQHIELGYSDTAKYYGITCLDEAKEYLKDDVLRSHLIEISEALYAIEGKDIVSIVGYTDALKIKSCMTLFMEADGSIEIFGRILDKYYEGTKDLNTLELIDR